MHGKLLKNSQPMSTRKLIQSIANSVQHGCYVKTAVPFAEIAKLTFIMKTRQTMKLIAVTDDKKSMIYTCENIITAM